MAAVMGRGAFYYVTMTAVLLVLALSANTSFADFPRVCRLLATDRYLPAGFARRGSRLVFTTGILVLTTLAGLLLIAFGGITDRLIPLFAVGALLAFTLSQTGMVAHWRRHDEAGRRGRLVVNALGAAATSVALGIVVVSKFTAGAWLTALVIPAIVLGLHRSKRHNDGLEAMTRAEGPVDVGGLSSPVVVIPMRRLDQLGQTALRFALSISHDVYVVQVLDEGPETEDVRTDWRARVEEPVRQQQRTPPRLVLVRSPYRELFGRLLDWLQRFAADHPDRQLVVIIPELMQQRWYQFLVNRRASRLKQALLLRGGPRISVMSTPWYPRQPDAARKHP